MSLVVAAGDVATGVVLLSAGAVTWARVRDSMTGPLLVLAGASWLAGDLAGGLVHVHRGPLVHVLLTFPTGRVRSKLVTVVIALAYLDGLLPSVARAPWPTAVLMATVVAVAIWRCFDAHGVERRARLVPCLGAIVVGAPLTLAAIDRLAGAEPGVLAPWPYQAAVALTAVALAVDLRSGRSVRAAATGLVVDLADREEPRALRDALSRAVGDPLLEIAYRVGDGWVSEGGKPVRLPVAAESGARVVTLVEDDGSPVAAVIHDASSLRDPKLAQSVGAAVRLVLANVRLQGEDSARVRDIDASRRRLLLAGDEQRRRIREQLRGGAEETLAMVSRELTDVTKSRTGDIRVALSSLVDELEAARQDLARFAQGVHPKALTEHGLSQALRELADRSALVVHLDASARRFPAEYEAAVYFVCSEALTNVAKHAEASDVSIRVQQAGSRLLVRVDDDGSGGADPAHGSGLRGLADRVEAMGGRLSVRSPRGAGTRLEAELPMSSEAS